MKNILTLLLVTFALSFASAQLTIKAPNGYVGVGNDEPTEQLDVQGNSILRGRYVFVGEDAGSAFASVEVGRFRKATGNAGFRLFTNPGTASGFNFTRIGNSNGNGISRLEHFGTNDFEISAVDQSQIVFKTDNVVRMILRSNGDVQINGPATVNGLSLIHISEPTRPY